MPAAPARRARSARRTHAAAPWPGIHEYSFGRSPNHGAVILEFTSVLRLAYHIPEELQIRKMEFRQSPASIDWLVAGGDQRPSRSGAIFLQASTRPCTAPTDLSNASRSLPVSSISTMRSTPFDPITTGTPTYMSLTPYSPFR